MYDSDRMAELLAPLGFDLTQELDQADLAIYNTCHIREKAAEKLYSDLGRIKPVKESRVQEGKDMMIAVAGCTAQAEGAEVLRRAPYVDMVVGPQSYHQLPEMIARAVRAKEKRERKILRGAGILNVEFNEVEKFDALAQAMEPVVPAEILDEKGQDQRPASQETPQKASAFLTIQEGCDKFCHFCVVPYTRGAEYSRPVADVLEEARRLIRNGVREITLLGQNVNAYHGTSPQDAGQEWGLGRLIYALAELDGLECIYYTTSHPRDVDQELINAHRDVPKLAPYLHLPVQSGSDRVLRAMNRKHTAATYLKLIDDFRSARPDIAFSSDFIVGYPGEDDRDHKETLKLVEAVGYASCYSFKYSKRPGTPAWATPDQVPEEVKDARLSELQALLNQQQVAFNQACVGLELPVLFERLGRKEGQLIGKSPYMQSVVVKAPERLIGSRERVKITNFGNNSLTGDIILHDHTGIKCA